MDVPLTAEIHRDGEWFVAFCPEVPEANGQGRTQEECIASLREAILLLMEDRREDARKRLKKGMRLRRHVFRSVVPQPGTYEPYGGVLM